MTTSKAVEEFLHVVDRLFGPKGCPWVHELDLSTLQRTLEEEVHEVLAAYAMQDWEGISDELGDLLFNVLCIAKVLDREGHGAWDKPFQKAADKYRRRNPHVFLPGRELKTSKDVELQWLTIKAAESKTQGKKESDLERSVRELPILPLFAKVIERLKHNPEGSSKIEQLLQEPSKDPEEQLAKDFMLLSKRAYQSNVSLEIAGKRLLSKLMREL